MEILRYQLSDERSYMKLISWLIENNVDHAAQYNTDSAGGESFHVTVRRDEDDEDLCGRLATYLNDEVMVIRAYSMTEGYESPSSASRDQFADPYTLRKELHKYIAETERLLSDKDKEIEILNAGLKKSNENKEFYHDLYLKHESHGKRLKEQIKAVAVLAGSISEKD